MRKTILTLFSIVVLGCGASVLAASTNGNGNSANAETGSVSTTNGNGNSSSNSSSTQNEVQTQTQTNNPGTGTMTQTQTQTQAEIQLQDRIQESQPEYSPKNEQAQTRMSEVAEVAEYLVRVAERVENAGIGDQIRTIARTQSENYDAINKGVDKVQTRSSFAYFFVGANFSELKNIQGLMEQNKIQVQELEKLMAEITVEADKLEIANQIIVLQNQQLELQDQVSDLSSGFSLFGWLNRWMRGVTI